MLKIGQQRAAEFGKDRVTEIKFSFNFIPVDGSVEGVLIVMLVCGGGGV